MPLVLKWAYLLTLLLIGIVLRGSAFAFRSHDAESAHKDWSVIFAIGSIITPFMLGLCLGTIASGRIPLIPVTESLNFAQYFITPWLQPFPILVGILTLWLCALLSSLYLLQRTSDFELQRDFRIRAFVFAVLTGLTAFGALFAAKTGAVLVHHDLLHETWSLEFQAITGSAALTVFISLFFKYDSLAQIAGVTQVVCMIGGWALSQFPYLIVDTHTIFESAASHAILNPVLIALGIGAFALVPSFIWLYSVFGVKSNI